MSSMVSSWRTALRIARREARASKGRSSLVVAMIAFPMLALSFAAVSYDMFTLTGAESADRTMGTADARILWEYREAIEQEVMGRFGWPAQPSTAVSKQVSPEQFKAPTEAELLAKLPAGSRVVPLRTGTIDLRTADGVTQPNLISVDAENPITTGYVKLLEGRAPRTSTEVALSREAVSRLGTAIGGTAIGGTVKSGDGERSYTVVGVVEFPSLLEEAVLVPPLSEANPKGMQLRSPAWLVDTPGPVTWAGVRDLNAYGITVASREVFINPPPPEEVPNEFTSGPDRRQLAVGVLVSGLALLEIVLLAGPAFAVSARRRQRQLALVAANGGTPAQIRRMVLADGVVLGLLGAVVGVSAGAVLAVFGRPFIEDWVTNARAGGYRFFPTALAAIAGLAVLTGVLAALVPAFITARQNVISSLAGRRGATRSRKRWIVLAAVMMAIGSAVVVFGTFTGSAEVMLAGLVVGELGLVLCTPALVGLIARLGRILPLAPRIALRDAARNRAAAAPAISAVMAAVAGSVAVGLYFDSGMSQQLQSQQQIMPIGYATVYSYSVSADPSRPQPPSMTAIENGLRATLPVTEIRRISGVVCGENNPKDVVCLFDMQLPTDEVCPYVRALQAGEQLTTHEQRAAKADRRCDERAMWSAGSAIVDDGSALPILTGASAEDVAAATSVLHAGGVVVGQARYIKDGKVTFAVGELDGRTFKGDPAAAAPRMSFPAYLLKTGVLSGRPIVSPGAVAQAKFGTDLTAVVAATSREPTQVEEERFQQQMINLNLGGTIERGPRVETPIELWLIMGAAGLITLGAAAIGTGLAAADGRSDLSTLASVGASPSLRRGLSLSQSGVIAGLGSLLGAAAGLGAAVAVLAAMNQRYADVWPAPPTYPIAVPWLSLAAALLVVPFVAILGAGMMTRSRLPIERRL